jgi:hypothetical protein
MNACHSKVYGRQYPEDTGSSPGQAKKSLPEQKKFLIYKNKIILFI